MKIDLEFPDIKIDEKFLSKLQLQKLFNAECVTTIARLKSNLDRGLDANGSPLKAYSKGYAEAKGSETVNLLVSGDMRRGMVAQLGNATIDEAKITFQGGGRGRSISNAGLAGSLYNRGFQGWVQLGKIDIDRIIETAERAVNTNLKNLIKISKK